MRLSLYHGAGGTVVNSNITRPGPLSDLPKYKLVRFGGRVAVFGGFCLGDKSIYNVSSAPDAATFPEASKRVWAAATKEAGRTPDLFVPMTHQLIADDEAFGEWLAGSQMAGRTPVILGGHEHEEYLRRGGGSTVVKMGQDAETIGIVDIWLSPSGEVSSKVWALPSTKAPVHEPARAWVAKQKFFVKQALGTSMARIPVAGSSKRVRHATDPFVQWLLGLARRGLASEGRAVEMVLMNGGSVRGRRNYKAGEALTLRTLYDEFAFHTPLAVVNVPGRILEDSVRTSRSGHLPNPGLLHTDAGTVVEAATHTIASVLGQAFDPGRTYAVAVNYNLLVGMDNVQPLSDYFKEHSAEVSPEDSCPEAKLVIIKFAITQAWRRLLGISTTGSVALTREKSAELISTAFATMDTTADGKVSISELQKYVDRHLAVAGDSSATSGLDNDGSPADASEFNDRNLIERMIATLDVNADGQVSQHELLSILHVS